MRGEILYPGDLSYFFLLSYCFLSGPSCSVPSVFACQLYKLGHRNRGTKFCLLLTCLSQTLRWTFKRNNDASNETKTLHQYNTSIVQTLLLLNPSCHRPSDKQSVRQSSLVTFSVLCEFFPQPFHAFVTPLPSNQLCSLHSRQIQRYKYKSRCYAMDASLPTSSNATFSSSLLSLLFVLISKRLLFTKHQSVSTRTSTCYTFQLILVLVEDVCVLMKWAKRLVN
ncbi:hypothetical protein T06_14048 [Trichinella sp. T6]|nr:hypothetical protein T06_14048 [Trichinella sp. T6]